MQINMGVIKNENQICIHGKWFEPFITENELKNRVYEIGHWLRNNYAHSVPVFLSILNGSFFFAADVIRHFSCECEISFIKMSSYQGKNSSGEINVALGLNHDLNGRDVIILEDIIDTGRTIHALLNILSKMNTTSIHVITLLDKPAARIVEIPITFSGFVIENKFVVGYGLDYDQYGRNLKSIYKEVE